MRKSNLFYLQHIRSSIHLILHYTIGMTEDEFLKNQLVEDAVVRNFEIIGEATKKLSKEFRDAHPQCEWEKMAGMRDKLIHDYIGVDYLIVWDTIKEILPKLYLNITQLIEKENAS